VKNEIYTGDWFAFLMIHTLEGKKKSTVIGSSKNPIWTVHVHNKGLIYNKDTRMAMGHWRLAVVLGPFLCKVICDQCCADWLVKTRGVASKIAKGSVLMTKYNVDMYCDKENTPVGLEDFLDKYAPANYKNFYSNFMTYKKEIK
jgi:hypothetical protein